MSMLTQRLVSWLVTLLVPGATSLHIVFGAHAIPHPAKASTFGEDAFFFDDCLDSFGIADGVGGSAKGGTVDPGEFSREVLSRCHQVASINGVPKLSDALKIASQAPISLGGSTTLVIGQLEAATKTLRLQNLGDSGAMLLRPSIREFGDMNVLFPRCVLRSQDQYHGWNWPFQANANNLASISDRLDEISTVVCEGDVLIAATDGVLDNLFDQELQGCVSEQLDVLNGDDPIAAQGAISLLAKSIAEQASAIGQRQGEKTLKTPYGQAAAEEGYDFKGGGKLDDVAIVCGVVRKGERPRPRLVHNFEGPPTVTWMQPSPEEVVPADMPEDATRDNAASVTSESAQRNWGVNRPNDVSGWGHHHVY